MIVLLKVILLVALVIMSFYSLKRLIKITEIENRMDNIMRLTKRKS